MLGKRVVAANSAPCGICCFCRRGKPNLCEDLLFNNGAYAEYIRIPARIAEKNTLEIPDAVSYRDAALTEPLACVLKGLDDTGARAGDTVTVIGLGAIGMMFVILAKLKGARVIAVGRREEQIREALRLGADEGVIEDAVQSVIQLTGGHGSAHCNRSGREAGDLGRIGFHAAPRRYCKLLRRPAAGTMVSLDTNLLHYSELTCKASFHHTPDHIGARSKSSARGMSRLRIL